MPTIDAPTTGSVSPEPVSSENGPLPYFPLFLDVTGRLAVVVGDGTIALAKAGLLARCGAAVRLVTPDTGGADGYERTGHPFRAADLDGAALVVVASGGDALIGRVRSAAAERRIPVNVVDRPRASDFVVPAILDRAPVLVAIGTGGVAPALARILRQRLETAIPAGFGRLAAFAGRLRARVKDRLATPLARQRYWDGVLDGPVADLAMAGREGEAVAAAEAALDAAACERPAIGTVTLVGAGPGDPELLTVAAVRAIQKADVILYDHLVGDGILDLARREAEHVCVGKRSGCHSMPQEEISRLMARHARAGRGVVRLKGGDPMLFGRAGEELDHLRAAGIPTRVIPGVTAALGCAASAGVSLTRRGVSRAVHFVTAHRRAGDEGAIDWRRFADPDGTLAVYMGRDQLASIAAALIAAGLPPGTPALVVENGTRPDERRHATNLAGLSMAAGAVGAGPALLLVGRAVEAPVAAERAAALAFA